MRISDWGSDVCSSDLAAGPPAGPLFDRIAPVKQQLGQGLDIEIVAMVADGLIRLHRPIFVVQPHRMQMQLHVLAGGDQTLGISGHGLLPEVPRRSEEHTAELQSLMRISYAVFCLNKKH